MGSDKNSSEGQTGASKDHKGKVAPEWADGLKQLYDAVVDEPLPDAFKDLLEQLDDSEQPHVSTNASGPDGAR